MSIRKFGIYLSYPSASGIHEGDYEFIEWLKAAAKQKEAQFVIACPSWSAPFLKNLMQGHAIDIKQFEFISPSGKPVICRYNGEFFEKIFIKQRWLNLFKKCRQMINPVFRWAVSKVADLFFSSRKISTLITLSFGLLLLSPIILALGLGYYLIFGIEKLCSLFKSTNNKKNISNSKLNRFDKYPYLIEEEASRLIKLINNQKGIEAWLVPCTSWVNLDAFHVPIVVYAGSQGFNYSPMQLVHNKHYNRIDFQNKRISKFITSDVIVKEHILMGQYDVKKQDIIHIPSNIEPISKYIKVTDFTNNDMASVSLCRNLLRNVLGKLGIVHRCDEPKYIFCPSFPKANVNLMGLLKAYKFLLENNHITCQLIIYCNKEQKQKIESFIIDNQLMHHVVCINQLSAQELAVCYSLAQFTIDPSFDFSDKYRLLIQSLSVGTPIVMSKDEISSAIFEKEDKQLMSLFDSYSWQAIASKMQWALQNGSELLLIQTKMYEDYLAEQGTSDAMMMQVIDALDAAARGECLVGAEVMVA